MSATIADVVASVHRAFPPEWAESWDRVGLLAGDANREVVGVSCALDASVASVRAAADEGANLLVTHHPAFLEAPAAFAPGRGPSAVVFEALDRGIALLNAHTNLDRAPQASGLLPGRLGLDVIGPIERRLQPMALVTVYVPTGHEAAVADAMAAVGAGRIGDYERCLFRTGGTGEFTPPASATPFAGVPGQPSSADEVRLEMVAPKGRATAAVEAARAAHPYEEPLITVTEVAMARSSARMGVLCDAGSLTTLDALVETASAAFGVTPRVWGAPSALLTRIATATGSA
ncbi:MAG: Nif3-like dinuclear metal center hexameric protein, partial [Coriobacteriales bacterium]|nr:Nif3-like dinuclear metal center hexameric protein [Coriobacteriales bacterium]